MFSDFPRPIGNRLAHDVTDLRDLVNAHERVHFGHQLGQFFAEALRQAAGHKGQWSHRWAARLLRRLVSYRWLEAHVVQEQEDAPGDVSSMLVGCDDQGQEKGEGPTGQVNCDPLDDTSICSESRDMGDMRDEVAAADLRVIPSRAALNNYLTLLHDVALRSLHAEGILQHRERAARLEKLVMAAMLLRPLTRGVSSNAPGL